MRARNKTVVMSKVENWIQKGSKYVELGDFKSAIEIFQKGLKDEPENEKLLLNLGNLYDDIGDYNKAIDVYKKILGMDDQNKTVWYNLGNSLRKNKEFYSAIKAYKRVIEIDVYQLNAWNNLGCVYYEIGEKENAIDILKKTLNVDSNYKLAWYNLACIYSQMREYDKSIQIFKKAIEIDPGYKKAWDKLEIVYKRKNEFTFDLKNIKILRGGDWKVEGDNSIFYFKVKIINNSQYLLSNIQIILTSKPKGLKIKRDRIQIESLNPHSFIAPRFKFKAKESCVGEIIKGMTLFIDYLGNSHTIEIKPFRIKYVCNLLVKKKVTKDVFYEKVSKMDGNRILFDCKGQIEDINNIISDILKKNNFYLLKQLPDYQKGGYRKLEGFAQGKYDNKEVALAVYLEQKLNEHTQLIIDAMSEDKAKTIDILRDISSQCNEIKISTELIKEYTSKIEEIFERVDDLESFLIKNLGSDWTKVRYAWQEYKEGIIDKKQLIKEFIKVLGKKFILALVKKFI